jgi:hypothetical protein
MPETAGTPELPLSPGAERLLGAVPDDERGGYLWLFAVPILLVSAPIPIGVCLYRRNRRRAENG